MRFTRLLVALALVHVTANAPFSLLGHNADFTPGIVSPAYVPFYVSCAQPAEGKSGQSSQGSLEMPHKLSMCSHAYHKIHVAGSYDERTLRASKEIRLDLCGVCLAWVRSEPEGSQFVGTWCPGAKIYARVLEEMSMRFSDTSMCCLSFVGCV